MLAQWGHRFRGTPIEEAGGVSAATSTLVLSGQVNTRPAFSLSRLVITKLGFCNPMVTKLDVVFFTIEIYANLLLNFRNLPLIFGFKYSAT